MDFCYLIFSYGIYSMSSYKRNVDRLMGLFRQTFPNSLFLWLSALPVSNSSKGGVIIPKAEYIRPILPGLIRDGNYYCSQVNIPFLDSSFIVFSSCVIVTMFCILIFILHFPPCYIFVNLMAFIGN